MTPVACMRRSHIKSKKLEKKENNRSSFKNVQQQQQVHLDAN